VGIVEVLSTSERRNMKVLISGQSGFLGSALSKALSSKGYNVSRITQELLYSPSELKAFFLREQPDYIYHLAAYGNMAKQTDIPMTVMANLIGSFNMLKESIDIPYKAFINFGSSSEYGVKEEPMSELDVLQPDTFYGASKGGATLLARAFAKQFVKPIVTIRPFSVYGPAEADFRFIPTVIRSILNNQSFTLDEKAVHDWIYVDDFIEAVMLIAEKASNITNGIVNVGTGRMHTNKEVCELLKKISGKAYLATSLQGMRKNDSSVWMANNSYLTGLGWYPKTMLQEGLTKTWEYYKEKYAK
jgi:nucleoside-diphosphate-sugar epimerase